MYRAVTWDMLVQINDEIQKICKGLFYCQFMAFVIGSVIVYYENSIYGVPMF